MRVPDIRYKLLLVSALPPPNGGVASWTQTMVKNGLPNDFTLALVNTRMPPGRRLFDSDWNPLREAKRTVSILYRLARSIFSEKPDVVHVNSSMAKRGIFRDLSCVLISRVCGRPVVVQYRGDVARFIKQNPRGFRLRIMRAMVHLATRNLVLNSSSANLLSNFRPGDDKRPLLIPNYIDDAIAKGPSAEPEVVQDRPRVLFVGGLAQEKGTNDIVKLARRFPQADFVLIGCPSRDLQLPGDLPGNFIQRGELSRADTYDEFRRAHIFLFPSYSEGFPNAVLEAMSIGLPVVASNVGAIPDMVLAEGGVLAAPGDLESFARAIASLLESPDLRVRMGEFNRARALNTYVYSEVASRLTEVYRSVIVETTAVRS